MKPLIGITADRDGERSVLKDDYASAIRRSGGVPVALVSPAEVPPDADHAAFEDEVLQLAGVVDGLVLPGGADLVPGLYGQEVAVPGGALRPADIRRSTFERALILASVARKTPIFGICYGMQLLNVALTGTLFQDIGRQVPGALDHEGGYHGVRILRNPAGRYGAVARPGSSAQVNSTHHQSVKTAGRALEVFAVAEDGIIEGLFMEDYPFLVGVQWHPERILSEALSHSLFSAFIRAAASCSERRDRSN